MRMQHLFAIATVLISGMAFAHPPQHVTHYRIEKLRGLDGSPADINNFGTITGEGVDANSIHKPYVWTKRDVITLDPQGPFTPVVGNSVNDRGQVVGFMVVSDSSGVQRTGAFLWTRGHIEEIEGFPGGFGVIAANAVNNRGQVAGYSDSNIGNECFLWEHGSIMSLGDLPGGSTDCDALAINDFGVVVGFGRTADGFRPFLWREAEMSELSIPPDAKNGVASAINNFGLILGGYTGADNTAHPVLWYRGHRLQVPLPAGFTRGGPNALNDWGDMVGTAVVNDATPAVAYLWHHLEPIDLNTRIVADDPLKPCVLLNYGMGINDMGEIAILGTDFCAGTYSTIFRLVPVREGRGR